MSDRDFDTIKRIVEAVLLAADRPLTIHDISGLFTDPVEGKSNDLSVREATETEPIPSRHMLQEALSALQEDCESRSLELKEVAGGFRYQLRVEYAKYIRRLWLERPARYSRALLETLAIIAYRQPITRAEIEEIRGVNVATSTIKTLREREWIRVLGHRDVPGRPAIYGTTREFLSYFGLNTLDELPPLGELKEPGFFALDEQTRKPEEKEEEIKEENA
uniref:Condensin subunit ScpB n=1 Tax=Candidatus Kentrum sp. MB TaxID=2138164 RepID=A0A450XPA2_9GAMM|nr:MAG: condensin subunit ScpB [Candidatus Kentron sp. MB]VFK35580.1 MAG: condensin subunit ScpB [Candidatus Kentron sp. MB]VFK77387.1 MAG: condensin subunit ScpB [Candidatus Kentron sp. MB]